MKLKRILLSLFFLLLAVGTILIVKSGESEDIRKTNLNYALKKETPAFLTDLSETDELKDKPDLIAEQWFRMTKDPALGYPPSDRKLAVYKRIQEAFPKEEREAQAIAGVTWTSRGPNNVGGKTRAVMFDPNDPSVKKVFAGSASGGLWVNSDITKVTQPWHQVPTIISNLAISSITYDPNATNTFYLGTGPGYFSGESVRGEGIWKSTDGGTNWEQLSSTKNEDFYHVLRMIVTDNGALMATTRTGLFRSIDNGISWVKILEGQFNDLEIASDETIYATSGVRRTSGAVFKSTDDGETWKEITPQPLGLAERIELASAPSDPNIVYAVASEDSEGNNDIAWFRKSEDKGETWIDIEIPLLISQECTIISDHFTRSQSWFNLILKVHPADPEIVIAGGIDLNRTTNGGASWEPISYWLERSCADYHWVHADQHEVIFRPGHPNEAIFGNDGGVFYSSDLGTATRPTFDPIVRNYVTTQFYAMAMGPEFNSDLYLAGAQDNGTSLFTQPGMNSTIEITGSDGVFCFIDKDNPDVFISSFPFNQYILSTDGGNSFRFIISDPGRGRFLNPADYDQDAKILYTGGQPNEYLRVTDITTSPSDRIAITIELKDLQITAIRASPYVENRLFVAAESETDRPRVFIIDDAHSDTPQVSDISETLSGIPDTNISSIEIGASDDQILITLSNYGIASVLETTDGGTTWVNKEDNLPDMPVWWAIYNPNNRDQVLLATEMGVWSTTSFSSTPDWEPTNSGLATVKTTMIRYRPSDQQIAVSTLGRGLFTSNVFATTTSANFKAEKLVAYVGHPLQFTDASVLPNEDWDWEFGDGETSNEQNPLHIYNTPGVYDVSLKINGATDEEIKTSYVTVLPSKATPYLNADGGDFESNPGDFVGLPLLGDINVWERGTPGNALTELNSGSNAWKTKLNEDLADEGLTYSSALYSPVFDLSDATKDYKVQFQLSLESRFCNAPIGLQLQYSTDLGDTWQRLGTEFGEFGSENWYFRSFSQGSDGCQIDFSIFPDQTGWSGSVLNNQTTSYPLAFLAGEPTVSFRFVNAVTSFFSVPYDDDGYMIDDFQILTSEPSPVFNVDRRIRYEGEEINFEYKSNGATAFEWDFGDGSTSLDENPAHTYSSSGSYNVSLKINTPQGEKTELKEAYIHVLPRLNGPLTLENGGDFETNPHYFKEGDLTNASLTRGESAIDGKSGTNSGEKAWVLDIDSDEYQNNARANLYTPAFNMENIGIYTLSFDAKFGFEADWDGFILEYSIDFGKTWTKLNDRREATWYNSSTTRDSRVFRANSSIFSGTTNGSFQSFSTDISSLRPNSFVAFRFVFRSDGRVVDVGMAIDNFQFLAPESGEATADFVADGVSGCSGQEVIFSSTSTGSISSMAWDFGENAQPQTATGIGPHRVIYTEEGQSTVKLSLESPVNGSIVEEKIDFIQTAPSHSPFFVEEANDDKHVARLVASSGSAFQWYFNDQPIHGAIEQVYLAGDRGAYSVDVTVNGCKVRTGQIAVITATEFNPEFDELIIYPNPVKDIIKIKFSKATIDITQIVIYDIAGKKVLIRKDPELAQNEAYEFDLSALRPGAYLVEIISSQGKSTRRILKEN